MMKKVRKIFPKFQFWSYRYLTPYLKIARSDTQQIVRNVRLLTVYKPQNKLQL